MTRFFPKASSKAVNSVGKPSLPPSLPLRFKLGKLLGLEAIPKAREAVLFIRNVLLDVFYEYFRKLQHYYHYELLA